jgi:hypothetical protein
MRRAVRRIRTFCCGQFKGEQGQLVVIVALSFVTFLALVGVATDVAVVFVHQDHLRRAVDASAVAAVGQYREGRQGWELYDTALETLQLHLPDAKNMVFGWCQLGDGFHNESLCAAPGEPPRKVVRVEAELDVPLIFLRLVWDDYVTVRAYAEAEAAVLNMVLLIDTSESMAYTTCDPNLDEPDFFACLETCVANESCEPFHLPLYSSVRDAAYAFVDSLMRDQVDQVAVYHFDRTPVITQSVESYTCILPEGLSFPVTLTASSGQVVGLTYDKATVLDAIMDPSLLNVYVRPSACDAEGNCCTRPTHVGGMSGELGQTGVMSVGYGYRWASTNIGGGLEEALAHLVENGNTDAAVWVIVLISDGAANATDQAADVNGWVTCPSALDPSNPPWGRLGPNERKRSSVQPFCRDSESDGVVTRHCGSVADCTNPAFCDDPGDLSTCWYTNWGETDFDVVNWVKDADDYARDAADRVAAQQIAIYTIGFGDKVINESRGRPDAGERLLRYIADVGDDGSLETAPCGSDYYWDDQVEDPVPANGQQCGNYWYAPDAEGLEDALEDVASRIFSRITQ